MATPAETFRRLPGRAVWRCSCPERPRRNRRVGVDASSLNKRATTRSKAALACADARSFMNRKSNNRFRATAAADARPR